MNFLVDFFSNNFENCVWLAIILIAICPTLESKIAIPLAMNTDIWGNNALPPAAAMFLSLLGSLLPCYLIMFIARKLKGKTTGFLTSKVINHYYKKTSVIESKKSNIKKYIALAGFASVPLPLTGVWASSLIAGFSNLDLKYAFLSITIGSIISTAAITLLCTLFTNSISYILIISLVIIITFLFFDLFLTLFRTAKKEAA